MEDGQEVCYQSADRIAEERTGKERQDTGEKLYIYEPLKLTTVYDVEFETMRYVSKKDLFKGNLIRDLRLEDWELYMHTT